MRHNRLRGLLAAGDLAVNAWVSTGDPYTCEVLGHTGFDSVTVDLQHGMFGLESAIRCLQAISTGPAVPLARCRANHAEDIGHLLDAGAYGVICPGVDTGEQAARFVSACRYPPRGQRSYGPARALVYGGPDYPAHSDSTVQAIAMIESAAAVANLDEILAVDGLDAIYIGPSDLSLGSGWELPSATVPEPLNSCLQTIIMRAMAAKVPAGIFALTAEQARLFASWGYQLLTPGNDIAMLRAEAARRITVTRGAA